jgi:hypothetical protein
VLVTALLAATGCGSKGNVHGKVYYKEKALTNGTVTFTANKKTLGTAKILEDGSYEMKDVPAKEATITVTPGLPIPGSKIPPVTLPKEVSDPEKSTEKLTVKAGEQEHDIKLK